jgi:hypothetical protein
VEEKAKDEETDGVHPVWGLVQCKTKAEQGDGSVPGGFPPLPPILHIIPTWNRFLVEGAAAADLLTSSCVSLAAATASSATSLVMFAAAAASFAAPAAARDSSPAFLITD